MIKNMKRKFLKKLKKDGFITSREIIRTFGYQEAMEYIRELRKEGYNIQIEYHDSATIYKLIINKFSDKEEDEKDYAEKAFENAVKRGMKDPDNWMYMYSENSKDYFKNCNTRKYKSYINKRGE